MLLWLHLHSLTSVNCVCVCARSCVYYLLFAEGADSTLSLEWLLEGFFLCLSPHHSRLFSEKRMCEGTPLNEVVLC